MLKVMALPSDQAFVIRKDKIEEFLAIKPDKEADAVARKRVENFKRLYRKDRERKILDEEQK